MLVGLINTNMYQPLRLNMNSGYEWYHLSTGKISKQYSIVNYKMKDLVVFLLKVCWLSILLPAHVLAVT